MKACALLFFAGVSLAAFQGKLHLTFSLNVVIWKELSSLEPFGYQCLTFEADGGSKTINLMLATKTVT